MPRNLSDLPEWIKASSIEDMRNYFIKNYQEMKVTGYC